MTNTVLVRVTCTACREKVQVRAEALRELGARLSAEFACPECGEKRPVSLLRTADRTASPQPPAVSTPPFRPLLVPTQAPQAPRPADRPTPAPGPCAPFAPLESPHGSGQDPLADGTSPRGWRKMTRAKRKQLGLALAAAAVFAGFVAATIPRGHRAAPVADVVPEPVQRVGVQSHRDEPLELADRPAQHRPAAPSDADQ